MYRILTFLLIYLSFFSASYGAEALEIKHPKNVLIAISGSISCYKTASLISQLKKEGYDVKTLATSSAMNFIGGSTLEGLTGHRVEVETFEEGS
ncbi:MAG: phosphopantothenoylcysteine decarboxylase [Chlamydiales bacterium]|jgi:phosphopantothenoylcysteine decarboxylase